MASAAPFRRLFWPAALLLGAFLLLGFAARIEQETGLPAASTGGVLAYVAGAWLGSRLFGLLADRRKKPKRPYPRLFKDLVAALMFLAAIVASGALLLDQGVFGALAGSSLILAMLGFAVRNVVADILSGIALGVEAPYRIGDWVEIDQAAKGRVIEIGWRTTRVLTLDSTYLILPNSQIARRRITNYSAPKPQYRAQISLKLSHDLPVDSAKRLVLNALQKASLIQSAPAPDMRVIDMTSDGILYTVRFWSSRYERDADCRDEVLSLIDTALRQAKVAAPSRRIEFCPPQEQRTAWVDPAEEAARLFAVQT